MDTSRNKPASFVSGIFPGTEAPPPPPPQAPKHAVSEEQVASLNKKIELMGETIIGKLEKKLAEKAPASPEQPAAGAAMLAKIGEMEARLKDFQEKFLLGASQIKNIEESKIGARREIEDLLKAVREQQKYSELDRQMHDQLEKAWGRVEEMEKRLLDFYGTISARPAPADPAQAGQAAWDKLEARLDEKFRVMEAALKDSAAKIDSAAGASFNAEARARELAASLDAKFDGLAAELRRLKLETAEGKERIEAVLATVKKDILSSVSGTFSTGVGKLSERLDGLSETGGKVNARLKAEVAANIAAANAESRGEGI